MRDALEAEIKLNALGSLHEPKDLSKGLRPKTCALSVRAKLSVKLH